jgi:hypothetical protein
MLSSNQIKNADLEMLSFVSGFGLIRRLLAALLEHGLEISVASGRTSTVSTARDVGSIALGSSATANATETASLETESASSSATLLAWS